MTTNYDWATSVLWEAGLPTNAGNIDNVARWMAAENPPSNWWRGSSWNPLNVNASGSGSDSFASLTQSAFRTAQILRQPNMHGIYQALATNQSIDLFSAAVVASPWASSHYGGNPLAIASIPQPGAYEAPGSNIPPAPPPPLPTAPTEEQMMTGSYAPNGAYTVSAAQAGTNHLLVFTLEPGQPWSVIDVTDAIQAAHPGQVYLVQP